MLVLALAAIGCGGHPEDTVDGTWWAQLDAVCSIGLTIDSAASTYTQQFYCPLEGGGNGADVEAGKIAVPAVNQLTFVPTKASCPTSDHSPDTAAYTLSNGHLGLVFPAGALVFERVTAPPTGTAIIRFGCWANGLFTESPLQAVGP